MILPRVLMTNLTVPLAQQAAGGERGNICLASQFFIPDVKFYSGRNFVADATSQAGQHASQSLLGTVRGHGDVDRAVGYQVIERDEQSIFNQSRVAFSQTSYRGSVPHQHAGCPSPFPC